MPENQLRIEIPEGYNPPVEKELTPVLIKKLLTLIDQAADKATSSMAFNMRNLRRELNRPGAKMEELVLFFRGIPGFKTSGGTVELANAEQATKFLKTVLASIPKTEKKREVPISKKREFQENKSIIIKCLKTIIANLGRDGNGRFFTENDIPNIPNLDKNSLLDNFVLLGLAAKLSKQSSDGLTTYELNYGKALQALKISPDNNAGPAGKSE